MARFLFNRTDSDTPPLGGKAGSLLELERCGLTQIPAWFAVLPSAGLRNRTVALQARVEIENALRAFPKKTIFAVRSSALDEDGCGHSFAGQFDSFLNVPLQKMIDRIERVWASGSSPRVLAYRRKHKLPKPASLPVILIQEMLQPDASGVAFGADPVSGQRGITTISGLWGLGSALVSGDADADFWKVNRGRQIVERRIVSKPFCHGSASPRSTNPSGVRKMPVAEEIVNLPSLSDAQILTVSDLVSRVGKVFGRPQDIEWAFVGDQLYLLQSRPITSLLELPDPDGALQIWDNSNIAESYSGISSPLTFSFARRVYEEVYRQFCRVLSVPESRITENADTFRRMLGYIRGQIFYNLVSWYRVLALLPGFQINRTFMEQMMGVKEGLPPEILEELTERKSSRLLDAWFFFRSICSLVRSHFRLEKDIRSFYVRLETSLAEQNPPLSERRADELAAYYRRLESELLTHWDAPLVNDFFAMIFHGLLRKLASRWCHDQSGTLSNELIAAQGGIISAEPAYRLRKLASLAAADAKWTQLLQTGSLNEIQRFMSAQVEFSVEYESYLTKFSGRCLEELKLETETFDDDPLLLLRSIGRLASTPEKAVSPPASDAPRLVASALREHPLRRLIFKWVLRNARRRVRDRENLRFERTRVFGRVRKIFQEIGLRLFASQKLVAPRDIFYLGVEEILGFIDGTALTTNLQTLVASRKIEETEFREQFAPDDRFETRGSVHIAHRFASAQINLLPDPTSKVLSGIGCSPGIVRGRARVIRNARNAIIEPGEILVAPRTDPGWILLFPSAAGLLVEFGSLLSHSAIVSRELGLPAIVSISGLTNWVKTGDLLEMDGSTGVIRKLT